MKNSLRAVLGLCALWVCMTLTGCTFPGYGLSDDGHNTDVLHLPTMTPGVEDVSAGSGLAALQDEEGVCDRAAPGHPIDVTVADGSVFQPGEQFTKTWRLVNAGDCDWSQDFAIVWFSGEPMGSARIFYLDEVVGPGESVDLSVEMTAPTKSGWYQSNWKMRNAEGEMFGLGPHGNAPFWVRIRVFDGSTPTIAALPTNTPIPMIYNQGAVEVIELLHLDVDSGAVSMGEDADVALTSADRQLTVTPLGGVKLGLPDGKVGVPPAQRECVQTALSADEVVIESIDEDIYICYQSSQGLPGYMWIKSVEDQDDELEVAYVTWFVP